MNILLNSYLQPMIKNNIDCLVLGCTHYPYLIPKIRTIVGEKMRIIDSGEAVARQTKAVLNNNNLLNKTKNKGSHSFYINKNGETLKKLLSRETINIYEKDF